MAPCTQKWRLINNTTDKEAVTALLTSARGTLSDFIQRFLTTTPEAQLTWINLKKMIIANFADSTGVEFALEDLSNIKQNKYETITQFLERLHQISNNALVDVDMTKEGAKQLTDKLLVHHFIYGLRSDTIRKAILKEECKDLDHAAEVARMESDIDRRANINSRTDRSYFNSSLNDIETDMDVNHAQRKPRCTICGKHHETSRCFRNQTNAVEPTSRNIKQAGFTSRSQRQFNNSPQNTANNFQRQFNNAPHNTGRNNTKTNSYNHNRITETGNFQSNFYTQRHSLPSRQRQNFLYRPRNQTQKVNFNHQHENNARQTQQKPHFDGLCWLCNRYGHKRIDCWNNPRNRFTNLNA